MFECMLFALEIKMRRIVLPGQQMIGIRGEVRSNGRGIIRDILTQKDHCTSG